MNSLYTRRDFLKLTGLLSLGTAIAPLMKGMQAIGQAQAGKKNVIVVVFDAFSAYHASLYGYQRETTPNIARLAERAVVYHNHYSGGNYTTPGTASLLTGVHPWKHRAFEFYGTVSDDFIDKNIFHTFDDYYRIAYTHNPLVNKVLDQFAQSIEEYIPPEQFVITNEALIHSLCRKDDDIATVSWSREMSKEYGYSYSLFLSDIYKQYILHKINKYIEFFPRGLPRILQDNFFILEDAINAIGKQIVDIPRPFLGYFHFFPPHFPYRTHKDFYNFFNADNLRQINKPRDIFADQVRSDPQDLVRRSQEYDEFILYVDREFGKFMDKLESSGLLEDTWVVLTSDHGELFERGILGHSTEVLYQPIVRIPLIIFEPGRKTRADVYTRTSAVDIFPTLLHVTGKQIPDWTEGVVLPPFSSDIPDPKRNIHVMEARWTEKKSPIKKGTFILVGEQYKLMYFFGYEKLGGQERVELYDVEQDREEINNLYPANKNIAKTMLDELKAKINEMNRPYL